MKVIITDNKTCYSYYDPEFKLLYTEFKGLVNYDLWKAHIQNVILFSKNNKVLGAIVDFRKLRGSFYNLFNHLEKNVQPNLQKRGFNVQAFIVSDDLITANVAEKLVALFRKHNGIVEVFTDENLAKEWVFEKTASV